MFVILFVPVFEKCVYPSLESRQSSPSINLRMFLGLLCAVFAMLCAGGVEVKRLELVHQNRTIVQVRTNATNSEQQPDELDEEFYGARSRRTFVSPW